MLITICDPGHQLVAFDLVSEMEADFAAGRVTALPDLRIVIQQCTRPWILRLVKDTVAHTEQYEADSTIRLASSCIFKKSPALTAGGDNDANVVNKPGSSSIASCMSRSVRMSSKRSFTRCDFG